MRDMEQDGAEAACDLALGAVVGLALLTVLLVAVVAVAAIVGM